MRFSRARATKPSSGLQDSARHCSSDPDVCPLDYMQTGVESLTIAPHKSGEENTLAVS